jgi:hypothetical protein
MLGVTFFGVMRTPVFFYVLMRLAASARKQQEHEMVADEE